MIKAKAFKKDYLAWIAVVFSVLWTAAVALDKRELERKLEFRECVLVSLNESKDSPPSCWANYEIKNFDRDDLDFFHAWTIDGGKEVLDSAGIFKTEFSEVSRKSFPLVDRVVQISMVSGWLIASRHRYYILYRNGDVVGICEGIPFKA